MTDSTPPTEARATWTDGANLGNQHPTDPLLGPIAWTASDLLPVHPVPITRAEHGALAIDVARWGAAKVVGLGTNREASERLLHRLATPAMTHTGCSFELQASPRPSHLGETQLPIRPHTDMAYRQHPPTLQLLHVLRPAAEGGHTTLVDGRAVVVRLDPAIRALLASAPVEFVAASEVVHLRSRRPLLEVIGGDLRSLAFNRLKLVAPSNALLCGAIDEFERTLEDPELLATVELAAGDALVFDNRRILHGRTAFEDTRRHLVGWFGNADDLESLARSCAQLHL